MHQFIHPFHAMSKPQWGASARHVEKFPCSMRDWTQCGPVDVLLRLCELHKLLLEDLGVIVELDRVRADSDGPPGHRDAALGNGGQLGVGTGKRFESHSVRVSIVKSHNVIRKGRYGDVSTAFVRREDQAACTGALGLLLGRLGALGDSSWPHDIRILNIGIGIGIDIGINSPVRAIGHGDVVTR